MKSFLGGVVFALMTVCLIGTAGASLVVQTYEFTAADMLNNVYVNGADGTTAVQNSLFDGARLRRDGSNGNSPLASRSYIDSQNETFQTWADGTTDRFLDFNLWGLNGLGAKWGDDYKPNAWGAQGNSAGWTPWTATWEGSGWGTPPAGYNTSTFIGWTANSFGDGVNFQDSDLASKKFSFSVEFDTDDMWWGGATNGAPNSLYGPKTFWFGGWFDNDYFAADNSLYMYEGNMVLTAVPEPGTVALLGIVIVGAGVTAIRRRKRS